MQTFADLRIGSFFLIGENPDSVFVKISKHEFIRLGCKEIYNYNPKVLLLHDPIPHILEFIRQQKSKQTTTRRRRKAVSIATDEDFEDGILLGLFLRS